MSFRTTLYRQFGNPTGALGWLAGWVMAHRPSNNARNRWTVSLLKLQPFDHALEIGFGPGLAIAHAAAEVSKGLVVGLDHSSIMMAHAQTRNREDIRRGRIELHCGGLEVLPKLNSSFDKVFSVNVVMFWPDRPAAFRTIRTVMREGGTLATTYQPRHQGATPADAFKLAERISDELRSSGFGSVRTEVLPLKPVPAVCVLAQADG